MANDATTDHLRDEVEQLRARLREAEETLDAIRRGAVDALIVEGPNGPQVFTLQSADEPYRLLVEQMREGALTLAADGLILYCNPRFAEILRLPPAKVVGRRLRSYLAEPDRGTLESVLAAGDAPRGGRELELRAADGTRVPVYLSAGALTVAGGEIHGLVVTDLTQQETRARLASIVETSDDAILSETPERVVNSWNAGAEKLFGYTAQEMVGRSAALLEPPERAGEFEAALRRLRETGSPQRFETVRIRKDGGRIDVSMVVSPLRDAKGRLSGLSIIARDITERRRAEEALTAAHARTVEILESIEDGFMSFDRDWRYTYINRAAARRLRKTPEELLGKAARDVFPEAASVAVHEGLRRAMERRVPVRFEAFEATSNEWFEVRAYPSPEGLSVFFADVTERKRAEEKLRLLAAELDHRVKNTLASVQSLMARSRRAGDTAEEFALRLEGRLNAKARTHNLLTASRWEGAELRELVEQELAPYGGGGTNVAIDGVGIVVRPAAALSLSLVLHELATNAAKYGALSRPAGRVEVTWEIDGAAAPSRLLLRWVESGGPPVVPPGWRGFGTTVIERSVAYELDGETELEFRPEGVRCLVRVPLATVGHRAGPVAAAPPTAPAATEPCRSGEGPGSEPGAKRILVVEDAVLVALDIEGALGAMGCQVVGPVGRLEEALELARAERLDGAILDVNLNGEEVFPVADELIRRGVPVIFSTGYDAASVLPARYRDRPRLDKPFAVNDLQRLTAAVFS